MANLVQIANMALARFGFHQAISSLTENSNAAQQCRTFMDEARRACLAENDWPFAKVLVPLALTNNVPPPKWRFEYARPPCIRVRALEVLRPTLPLNLATIPSGSASYLDFGGADCVGGAAYQGESQPNMAADRSPTVIPFTTGSVPAPVATLTSVQTIIPPPPPPPPVTSSSSGGYDASLPYNVGEPDTSGSSVSGGLGGSSGTTLTTYTGYSQPGGVLPVIWTNVAHAAAWVTLDVTDPNGWEPGFVQAFSWFLAAEIAVNLTGSAQVQQAMMQGAQQAISKAAASEGNEETQIASWNADWMDARGFGADCDRGGWGYGDGL